MTLGFKEGVGVRLGFLGQVSLFVHTRNLDFSMHRFTSLLSFVRAAGRRLKLVLSGGAWVPVLSVVVVRACVRGLTCLGDWVDRLDETEAGAADVLDGDGALERTGGNGFSAVGDRGKVELAPGTPAVGGDDEDLGGASAGVWTTGDLAGADEGDEALVRFNLFDDDFGCFFVVLVDLNVQVVVRLVFFILFIFIQGSLSLLGIVRRVQDVSQDGFLQRKRRQVVVDAKPRIFRHNLLHFRLSVQNLGPRRV